MRPRQFLFVDLRPGGAWAAVVSALQAPLVVEDIVKLPDMAALKDLAAKIDPRARYVRAVVASYPDSRLLRHATLENPAKAREETFFDEYLKKNYQLDLSAYSISILNPATGLPVDFEKVVPKEILVAGASQENLAQVQKEIVSHGVYPDRLELGTLATLGGLMHYQRAQQMGSAAVHIEWGADHSIFSICSAKRLEISRVINFGTNTLVAQIQKDLHLKDAASALKVLSTQSLDFNEMGPLILKPLIKELQAAAGYFEVQTGQPLQHFILTLLPGHLQWVQAILAQYLGLSPLAIDYAGWANTLGIKVQGDKVKLAELTPEHIGLFSLMTGGVK